MTTRKLFWEGHQAGFSWAGHVIDTDNLDEESIRKAAIEYSSEHGLNRHEVAMLYAGFAFGAIECQELGE